MVASLAPAQGINLDDTHRLELLRRLCLRDAALRDPGLRAMLMARCARDPYFWLDNFAYTYNPKKSASFVAGGSPHIPFMVWDFQRPVIDLFLGIGGEKNRNAQGHLWPVVQDKSRELGATWLFTEPMVWDWIYNEGADYGIMTRSGTDLDGAGVNTLFGKLDYVLERLPRWMVVKVERKPTGPDPLGAVRYSRIKAPQPTLYNWDTGASISGSKTVPDAFRGQRQKRTIVDEGASVPQLGKVMQSIDDVTSAPWVVSTPKGRGNFFSSLVHGEGVKTLEYGQQGLGWLHHRMHYSQHPERKPGTPEGDAWIEREKARRTDEAWAQEQEIDYSASAPGRIWKDFSAVTHVLTPDEWAGYQPWFREARLPVYEGWDFGVVSLTAAVWASYNAAEDTLYLLDYRSWREQHFDNVADGVGEAGWRMDRNPNGRDPYRRIGDPAGKGRDSGMTSWFKNLASRGIEISPRTLSDAQLVRQLIGKAIREGRLFCAPACAQRYPGMQDGVPTLVECLEQYAYDIKGDATNYVGPDPKPRKDQYSHAADALQYIAAEIWAPVIARMREQDR